MQLPLDGILVLDFSLFLAGPLCSLRLADLGARVIKIERPDGGDLCRRLYISNLKLDQDSMLFHSINRNKESFAANLKDPDDLVAVKQLIAKADVVISNFRPGVMERLGVGYEQVRAINPRCVYGRISGYGDTGPWKDKPGQDLLAQSLSGLTWLSGDGGDNAPPVPMGLSVADMFAGHFLAQGILALLVRRGVSGQGGLVETSLMEALLDFQFEVLTTHLNDGGRLPERCKLGNAHAYLGAPYGLYRTADGWLAIAMNPLAKLAPLLGLDELADTSQADTFARRDKIKAIITERLTTQTTAHWLALLDPADLWCAEVFNWPQLLKHEAFRALSMIQRVTRSATGSSFNGLRCPLRVDGQPLLAFQGSPDVGQQTAALRMEFGLNS
jgi:crotonobetainyl-CoA:carnitine CoA-transferase CaiB-like acyl-CoA transferase